MDSNYNVILCWKNTITISDEKMLFLRVAEKTGDFGCVQLRAKFC